MPPKAVTLCIAAHARTRDMEDRIVLCSDMLIGDDLGVSESAHKCDLKFLPGLASLYAGTLEHVQDLASLYKARMAGRTPTLADFKEELWVRLKEFKDTLSRRDIDYT